MKCGTIYRIKICFKLLLLSRCYFLRQNGVCLFEELEGTRRNTRVQIFPFISFTGSTSIVKPVVRREVFCRGICKARNNRIIKRRAANRVIFIKQRSSPISPAVNSKLNRIRKLSLVRKPKPRTLFIDVVTLARATETEQKYRILSL